MLPIGVRVPLRVPFAGGLTDVKAYAQSYWGATVSSTIGLGAEVRLYRPSSGRFEVTADGRTESAADVASIGNDLVREALRLVDPLHPAVHVQVSLDVVGKSGLGASGAIAVALLHAARVARGEEPSAEALAMEAARLEVEVLGGNSGYHDPHVCARGGLLRIDYRGADVTASPIDSPPGFREAFERSLLLFGTGRQASTKASLHRLSENLSAALPVLHDIKSLATEMESSLRMGDLAGACRCIGEQQRLKERLPGSFTAPLVTEVSERLARTGAAVQFPGGKVGGYMLVCCPAGQQAKVRRLLGEFPEVPLRFSTTGSEVFEITC